MTVDWALVLVGSGCAQLAFGNYAAAAFTFGVAALVAWSAPARTR